MKMTISRLLLPAFLGQCLLGLVSPFLSASRFLALEPNAGTLSSLRMQADALPDRREFIKTVSATGVAFSAAGSLLSYMPPAQAIGEIPEFAGDQRFLQHAVINVPDLEPTLKFFRIVLGMQVLRSRIQNGNNVTFIGYGPEQLSIPSDFVPGVSSLDAYGGHFSLELVSPIITDDDAPKPIYDAGNAYQYLQLAVPYYSIGKVIAYGGDIEYGYGWLKATIPGNIKLQVFFGDRGDCFQFVAQRVSNMKKSIEYYENVLGMKKLDYPQLRSDKSIFEPPKPKNCQLMGYNKDGTGVLLLPKGKQDIIQGSVLTKLAIVTEEDVEALGQKVGASYIGEAGGGVSTKVATTKDPDGYEIVFVEKIGFDKELQQQE